ncbi:immunity 26/phosphotriesterase HocA family protein [Paenibacillus sp. MMS18-CY102]|uniref:immunity 26/phosphotriesterase HocA family protein n=1 Tax=Paenibacillus sp. MMS18-CY102 TaxID=2682849 RepID=UPI0013663F22|nr:immunity 26/phosphotriesterase HocA family protein [Paenibacillus sp. MMS18-CY102]MWC29795.1 hypothetical protein [Paenibacillus sp. MMS18-CY102]
MPEAEQSEYLSFRLTNEHRPYFGLNQIEEDWEEVEIKRGTIVFYQGNTIRKVIHFDFFRTFTYKEFDTELSTNARQFIMPKTARGKEKKITPTNLLSPMPTGCTFYVSFTSGGYRSMVHAYNGRNNISLPIDGDKNLSHISELESWIRHYINTCPANYFDKVNKMREMPHRTIKYKVGDVFRFEIDREHYGFGLIIGEFKQLVKHVPKNHPWHILMTVPLLIRMFEIKTKDQDIALDDVYSHRLLRADVMSDTEMIWGTHEIVGNKKLVEADIEFPMHLEYTRDAGAEHAVYRFSWGCGMKETRYASEDIELMDVMRGNRFSNRGVCTSLPKQHLINVLQSQSLFINKLDLRHPDHTILFQKVLEWFGLAQDIEMDQFNRENSGLTREQYINLLAQS